MAGLSYYKVVHLTNTWQTPTTFWGFPYNSNGKESGCNARDLGSVPGLGRSPGEGNGYLFQYSCLENPMDRGAWQTTVHGVSKSWTGLSSWYFHYVLSLIHRRLLLVSQAFSCCPRAHLCFLRDSFFFFSILIQIPWNSFQLMKQQSVLALQLARMAKRLSSIVKEKWKWSCSVVSHSLRPHGPYVAYQVPPSMEFSRQEYWSGLPFPSPGDLPNPGIEPRSPTLQADALLSEPPGKSSTEVCLYY